MHSNESNEQPSASPKPSISPWRMLGLRGKPWNDREVERMLSAIDDPIRLRAFCATGLPSAAPVPVTTHPVALGRRVFDAMTLRRRFAGSAGHVPTLEQAQLFLEEAVLLGVFEKCATPRQLRSLAPMVAMVAPQAFFLQTDCTRPMLDAARRACGRGWIRLEQPNLDTPEHYVVTAVGRVTAEGLLRNEWAEALCPAGHARNQERGETDV